jgi:hypothetical protein
MYGRVKKPIDNLPNRREVSAQNLNASNVIFVHKKREKRKRQSKSRKKSVDDGTIRARSDRVKEPSTQFKPSAQHFLLSRGVVL